MTCNYPGPGGCAVETTPVPGGKELGALDARAVVRLFCDEHAAQYVVTVEAQTVAWVEGKSMHNEEFDECCPDFSCCRPELAVARAERERFRDASPEERESMLFGFLGNLVANAGDGVHLAGRGTAD
jgi:hypothetical protein